MDTQDRIAIVGGVRTPFVRVRTEYKKLPASTLGGMVLKETMARTDMDPKLVDECYFGIVSAPVDGPNVSREAVFDAALPPQIPCTSINRYCVSGLEATAGAAGKILSGQIDVALAGGVEAMSQIRASFSLEATDFFQDMMRAKTPGQKFSQFSKFKAKMLMPHAPSIKEPTTGLTMGQSADLQGREFEITREAQDEYTLMSHKNADKGWQNGFFKSHVMSVGTPEGRVVEKDTDIRTDTTLEKLGKLRPVFYKDGTISAGNACPLTDGASALLLMRESKARELRLPILGVIRSYANAAVDIKKEPLLIAPVYAIPKALKMAGVSFDQIDLIEMHEAFAAQVLSTVSAIESDTFAREKLGLDRAIGKVDMDRFNVYGGSIPLGHPFGATGGRLILQALYALRERKNNLGLISCCAGGGMGAIMIVEAV